MKERVYLPNKKTPTHHTKHYSRSLDTTDTTQRCKTAYSPDCNQARLILQAIRLNDQRKLSQRCIEHIAHYITHVWESNATEQNTLDLVDVIKRLVTSTGIQASSVNEALRLFCRSSAATPTPCPSTTLLIAVNYIERLKQKYNYVKGSSSCSQRLIIVAYMMAAKYMHSNLCLIVSTRLVPITNEFLHSNISPCRSSSVPISSILNDRTLPPLTTYTLPPTPPTSPNYLSDYHYFPSPSQSPSSSPSPSPKVERAVPAIIATENTSSPTPSLQGTCHDNRYSIYCMEIEFLNFLNYSLTLASPASLVEWAHNA
ncbi:hypothetical protein BDF14DRAFT_1885505 [Spinellus fusiger]|nr:hypothetical protein BDF14DRAFT_1885505 [Spinellus fusiger]